MHNILALIYIPIWLDLLSPLLFYQNVMPINLHSNMVRFIIEHFIKILSAFILFTFQYG